MNEVVEHWAGEEPGRVKAIVTQVSLEQGYFFCEPLDGGRDLFCHVRDIAEGFQTLIALGRVVTLERAERDGRHGTRIRGANIRVLEMFDPQLDAKLRPAPAAAKRGVVKFFDHAKGLALSRRRTVGAMCSFMPRDSTALPSPLATSSNTSSALAEMAKGRKRIKSWWSSARAWPIHRLLKLARCRENFDLAAIVEHVVNT
jgi:cold shock CspA family protein